jgi:hypothetical protein
MVALADWALMPKYRPNGHTFQPYGHQGYTLRVIGLGLLQSYLIGSPRDTEYELIFRDHDCRDDWRLILQDNSPKLYLIDDWAYSWISTTSQLVENNTIFLDQ